MLCGDCHCSDVNCSGCSGIGGGRQVQDEGARTADEKTRAAARKICGTLCILIVGGLFTGALLHAQAGLELGNGNLAGENPNNGTVTIPSEASLAYTGVGTSILMAGCCACACLAYAIPKAAKAVTSKVKSCWNFLSGRSSNTDTPPPGPSTDSGTSGTSSYQALA